MYNKQYGASYDGLTGAAYGQFVSSIILMCLIIIQFILGFLLRVQMFNNSLKNYLNTMKVLHAIGGYCITILGKVVATLIVNEKVSSISFRAWIFCFIGLLLFFLML